MFYMEILNSCLGVVEHAFNMPVFYFIYMVRPPVFGCFFIVLCLVKDFLKVSKCLCIPISKKNACVYVHMRAHVCMLVRTCWVSVNDGYSHGSIIQSR